MATIMGQRVATTAPTTDGAQSPPLSGLADPAPLGLAAFGITTLCLSAINAGWLGESDIPMVLALALPMGGVAQLLAGMWAFARGNTFAATAFSSFGAFWISYFLLVQAVPSVVAAGGSPNAAIGLYLFSWAIFTAYMLAASMAGKRAVTAVFLFLTITFLFLAFGKWADSSGLTKAGGYFGIITAVAALYTSFADVLNANFKKPLLPT